MSIRLTRRSNVDQQLSSQPGSLAARLQAVRRAAQDQEPIAGLTHTFYRYPGRFSPRFARAVIEAFSSPGDLVFDPYMGGGTTLVEALVAGRHAVGCDVNSLAVFVTKVKTTRLNKRERQAVLDWASIIVPDLSYRDTVETRLDTHQRQQQHLSLSYVRPLRKLIALVLDSIRLLPNDRIRNFARCVLLNVSQWALNGRRHVPTLQEFRTAVEQTAAEMIAGLADVCDAVADFRGSTLIAEEKDAAALQTWKRLRAVGPADLIVTSPPYPGIHVLYHRWQVDGRKETAAPYWIAACQDGEGAKYYSFADRKEPALHRYFAKSLDTLCSIRSVVRQGAVFVQLIAFADPRTQLPRYLRNMAKAGFEEIREDVYLGKTRHRRTWRGVPGRRWHARLQGSSCSSREVVLIHRAV